MTRTTLTALLLVLILAGGDVFGTERSFAVCLKYGDVQYRDLDLDSKIYNRVVADPRLEIVPPFVSDSVIALNEEFQRQLYVPKNMTDLAEVLGVRYLVWIMVESAGTDQKDFTLIPYVFQSHRKKYKVAVRYYILDTESGRTVASDLLEAKKNGPSALSYMDFDKNEPELFESYSRVKGVFAEMEEEISDKIAIEMVKLSHRR